MICSRSYATTKWSHNPAFVNHSDSLCKHSLLSCLRGLKIRFEVAFERCFCWPIKWTTVQLIIKLINLTSHFSFHQTSCGTPANSLYENMPTNQLASKRVRHWRDNLQLIVYKNNCSVKLAVNTVTLLGRVGNEPQKRGNDEHPVVTFSIATHNNYK